MAPKQLDQILSRVHPSRRAFLRQVLAGAAFATPLISSFSMGGLSFGFSQAAPMCGNMISYSPNQSPTPDTMQSVSAAYTGPTRFRAQLTIAGDRIDGRAALELVLDSARANLAFRLRTTVQLQPGTADQLSIQTPQGTYASQGLTTINKGYLPGSFLPAEGSSCSLEALMVALATGTCTASLTTSSNTGPSLTLTGTIFPTA